MFLSQPSRFPTPALAGLAVAAAALLAPASAPAQQPAAGPQIPPGARAFQASMIRQDYWQRRYEQKLAQASAPASRTPAVPLEAATPPAVLVTVTPPVAEQMYVAIRGPDGDVRRFPLEAGREAIRPGQIIVRAGESVTVRITQTASRK